MFETATFLVAALICLPAVLMAVVRSSWLVDYLFFVVALNRGVRRFVDYHNGEFNPYSLISLTPIIVGGLATLVVLLELNERRETFGSRALGVLYAYGIATAAAFVVGLVNARFAAVYALGDYIAPIGLIGLAALFASEPRVLNRWCHSMALSAVVVAAYGIWQFYIIPPWDAFWVQAVDFEGYLGTLQPTKMTLFSTMAERGPAASYLCGGLILLLLRPGTLSLFRWPAVALVLLAMLLTYSRTTVIQASLAVLLYPLLNRGTGVLPVAVLVVLIAVAGPKLLELLPGSDTAAARVATISSIQDDVSFQGRLMILAVTARESLTEPLGLGIGAHGLASRVSSATEAGSGDSTGYVETLRTFGWIGFTLIVVVLYRIWHASSELLAVGLDDRNVRLFRAWFVSGMIALFSGDWLFQASFFWVLAGYCLGQCDWIFELDDECDEEAEVTPGDEPALWSTPTVGTN